MQAQQSFAAQLFSKPGKEEDRCLTFKGGVAAISLSQITKGPSLSQRILAYLKSRCTSCLACKAEALCKQARMTSKAEIGEVLDVPNHIFWQQVLGAHRHAFVQQAIRTAVSIILALFTSCWYPTLQICSTVKLDG